MAVNLAAAAVDAGLTPLVICQDPQGTSTKYGQEGTLPFKVLGDVPKEKPEGVDLVLFDHQASDWRIPVNHYVLMPVKPARDQYTTYVQAAELAKREGKTVFTVVTDTQTRRPEERKLVTYLKEQGAIEVPSSGVFSRAAADYTTIFDDRMNTAYKVKERRAEFHKILEQIMEA